jgi:hypothetical protein
MVIDKSTKTEANKEQNIGAPTKEYINKDKEEIDEAIYGISDP